MTLISFSVFGQNQRPILKFVPLSLIDDVSFPTMQAGVEFWLTERTSWYNEFGAKYRKGYYEKADTNFYASSGFKAKTEVRYYLKTNRNRNSNEYYVAANMFFTKDFHNTEINYYYQQDSGKLMADDFGVKKKVWGINLLAGRQLALGKAFLLDCYAGLGMRARNIITINEEFDYNRDKLISPHDLNVQGSRNEADAKSGKSVKPNLTLGLRLCFKI